MQLTAVPDKDESFLGWSGDAGGTDRQLAVVMSQSRTIHARFTKRPTLFIHPADVLPGAEGTRLTLRGEVGQTFEIHAIPTLTNRWATLGLITNEFGDSQFLDTTATNGTMRFYRARVWP